MLENESTSKSCRPFPWRCADCREKQVFPRATDFSISVKHDGRLYDVHIPDLEIPTCQKCGGQVFSSREDDRITEALREQINLLKPEEIRRRRKELELSQQEMAEQIGVAKETISRWESGAVIQSRAMDNLLRLYFKSDEARRLLRDRFEEESNIPNIYFPLTRRCSKDKSDFDLHACLPAA